MIKLTIEDLQEIADFKVIEKPLIQKPIIAESDVVTIDNNLSTYVTGTQKRELTVNLGYLDRDGYEILRGFRDRQYENLKYPKASITADIDIAPDGQIIESDITKSFNLTTNDNPLGVKSVELVKIGNNEDYIFEDNGRFYVHKATAKIASYNGETITTDYISTTGGLTTGATVYYVLETPVEYEITKDTLVELRYARTYVGQTNVWTESNGVDLPVKLDYSYQKDGAYLPVQITDSTYANLTDTLDAPLDITKLGGDTFQQTYSGKNLFDIDQYTKAWIRGGGGAASLEKVDSNTLRTTNKISQTNNFAFIPIPNTNAVLGKTITLSSQVKFGSGATTAKLVCYWMYSGGLDSQIGPDTVFNTDGNYSLTVTIPDSIPSGATNVGYGIYASGNNPAPAVGTYVDYSNIQVEVGSTATAFEPYVGGVPAPNPDYPQDVRVVTGENTVRICGKNLFDKNTALERKRLNGSGLIIADSNYVASDWIKIAPSTTYAYSRGSAGGGSSAICYYDKNKTFISRTMPIIATTSSSGTVTSPATAAYARIDDFKSLIGNMQLEKGSTATVFEPYQSQSYELNLGKNLINISQSTFNANGVTVTVGADNTITLDGTPSSNYNSSPILIANTPFLPVGETYSYSLKYISGSTNGGAINLRLGATPAASNVQFSQNMIMDNTDVVRTVTMVSSGTVGVSGYATKIQLAFSTSVTFNNYKIQLQLEKGSTATTYVPYFTPIELCKIGDYQDYIHKSDGKWWLHKEIGQWIFNGTENWQNSAAPTAPGVKAYYTTVGSESANYKPGYSNLVQITPSYTEWANALTAGYSAITMNNVYLKISAADAPDVNTLKTFLSNQHMLVYYPLNSPTETELTNEDLINQLEDLWSTYGFSEYTTITTSADDTGNAKPVLEATQGDITGKGTDYTLEGTKKMPMEYKVYGQAIQNGTPSTSTPIPIETVKGNNSITFTGPSGRKEYSIVGKMTLADQRIIDNCGTAEQVQVVFRESKQI